MIKNLLEISGRSSYNYFKKKFDIFGALTAIILICPIFFFIGIMVKISSPGPIFYRGLRTGYQGIPFYIFKFRSMIVGADKEAGTTSRNDPRVTKIGKFLRKYKLDELPQLYNILRGEMSFVGPRPELPKYTKLYKGEELLILQVLPGITDYSSIKFSNLNELIQDNNPDKSFEDNIMLEKNKLRLKYIKERCFILDIKLIILTILRLVGAK
ncbi:sugar transferase [Alphaproteobacteria bacterium]|nr:sugar transferase [Alphaproteobacteria bacterium]